MAIFYSYVSLPEGTNGKMLAKVNPPWTRQGLDDPPELPVEGVGTDDISSPGQKHRSNTQLISVDIS